MNSENRQCQNCKKDFTIEPDDFGFYEKIKVPAPTFCPGCRIQRRFAWRNERSLYKVKCENCKKDIFSGYPASSTFPIFCQECWFSDAWDPMQYGREYDFSKSFFAQFKELLNTVPRLSLYQIRCVNSPYSNIVRDAKDCYLSFSLVGGEEIFYSKNIDHSRQLFDCLNVSDSEQCSWNIYDANNFNVHYSLRVRSCLDSLFLFDCHNARNCFMSSNIRNGEFIFRNKQLRKDEYETEIKKIQTGSWIELEKLKEEFRELKMRVLHKYADIVKSANSTGDALANVKNAKACFEAYDLEDVRYGQRVVRLKDAMDVSNTGVGSELMYEYVSGGEGEQNLKFSLASYGAIHDSSYTGWCKSSSNLFGCLGIRDKQYCIFNRQYSKEAYEEFIPRIVKHMNDMPYDNRGCVYRYGEFFPTEMSPFPYNDSLAQEYFPLSKDEIISKGFVWREPDEKNPKIDIESGNLMDAIQEIPDDILQKTIGCAHGGKCLDQCTRAFRVVSRELEFYRTHHFPLPRLCPNCRHYERLRQKNPWKLWHRQCMCDPSASSGQATSYKNTVKHPHHESGQCPNEFETSYAPDRPEIVYCETCYQSEVV
jgi:hypothetical protein